ncbi:hypothetical protein HPB52_024617 [Rhipicephalus sanguineus]|uniref:FAS1 domain-containing protein n=1 Tax=Rhipicephalus sanguineus TaxID=34632 RepID=A0A9D4YRZ9_RHISA|nr:hypothetical protein HPB52_024617 [Rhipicephalus sanguineus]
MGWGRGFSSWLLIPTFSKDHVPWNKTLAVPALYDARSVRTHLLSQNAERSESLGEYLKDERPEDSFLLWHTPLPKRLRLKLSVQRLKFYQLAERVKLFVAYSESTDITCFAPTNDAIDRFRESYPNKPIEVTYHVVSLNLAEDNLPSSVPTIAKGSPHLYLTRARDRFFFVNNAKVTRRRELTFEQYKQKLYVIDDVLEAFIPTSGVTPNAFEFLNQPSIYNLNQRLVFFHSRVQMTYEQSLFTEDGMHTFFVPVDDADPAKRTRVEIDKYVVRATYKNRRLFTDCSRKATPCRPSRSARRAWSCRVVKPNIPVKNGVVHLIEKPLMVVDTSIKDFFHRERTDASSDLQLSPLLRLHMIKNEAVASDEVLDAGRTGIFERESASSRRMLYMRVVEGEHGRIVK